MKMMLSRKLLLLPVLLASTTVSNVSAATLDNVINRGALRCGVNTELVGFARANSLGEYSGFDVDICRAVASAVFNDSEAVEMVPVSSTDRFLALQSGTLDILSRNTTWTLERNVQFGQFVGVNFYDGQGFMVPKRSGIRSALELDNQTICVTNNTTSELNAADFFAVSDIRYRPVFFEDEAEAFKAYTMAFAPRSQLTVQDSQLSAAAFPSLTPIQCCPRSFPRSRSDRWCRMATKAGKMWCAGPSTA